MPGLDTTLPTSEPSFVSANAGLVNQAATDSSVDSTQDTEQLKLFEFSQARLHLQRIVDDWKTEVEDTEVRRKTRDVDIDVEGLRQKGDIEEDETIVPVRVIDTNITREQPAYVNYLKNSRRICTFRSLSNPNQDSQLIEKEFTEGMTYSAWEKVHFKCVDGAQTHGWAAIEIVYDSSKPLNVGLEYIGHDELFWPRSVKNVQDSPRIIRAYDVTFTKLKEWIRKFGFNSQQVNELIKVRRDTTKENETIRIYKLLFKKEGIVYVAWFALDNGVSDWLKAPDKHYIGIDEKIQVPVEVPMVIGMDPLTGQPINSVTTQLQEQWQEADLTIYPIFLLHYKETEKPKETDHKGRVFLDENKQEAQTAILSAFINGLNRASQVYASPRQEDGTGSALKEIQDVKLVGSRILSKPLEFWHPDYPDPMVIKAMQYFDVSNSSETNQPNFAAMNREDSRKTATELGLANQQQQLLTGVNLTLYSTFIREIYSLAWLIVQSQALQNKIRFLLIDDGNGNFINNLPVISQVWELRAAGDVDVIQRQERIMQMKQDWPVIVNTPLASRFLADYLRLAYPDVGEQYASIVQAGNPAALVVALATVITGMIKQAPNMLSMLQPQEQAQLQQMLQQAAAFNTQASPASNSQQQTTPAQ